MERSGQDSVDEIDIKILSELVKDAKMPYTEIAERIFVSGGTVHVRMKKLEKLGVVNRATLDLNFAKLGFDISAYLGIYLEKSSLYDRVVADLEKIDEILTVYYTTGVYSIFAKIVCRDTHHLRNVLHDKIQPIEGITRTETIIVLEKKLDRPINLLV